MPASLNANPATHASISPAVYHPYFAFYPSSSDPILSSRIKMNTLVPIIRLGKMELDQEAIKIGIDMMDLGKLEKL